MKQKIRDIMQKIVTFIVALDYSPTEDLYREVGRLQQEIKLLKSRENLEEKDVIDMKAGNPSI
jgi:hypothetical protein